VRELERRLGLDMDGWGRAVVMRVRENGTYDVAHDKFCTAG
jgi:hypothetical protein